MQDDGRLSVMHGVGTVKITVGCLSSTSKQSFSSRRLLSQDHGRLPDKHVSKHSHKKLAHVLDSLVRTAQKKGAVATSTRDDACVFTGDPRLSSCRRRLTSTRSRNSVMPTFTSLQLSRYLSMPLARFSKAIIRLRLSSITSHAPDGESETGSRLVSESYLPT